MALPIIIFRLDARSGLAPYRQVADQVRQAIALGILHPGDRLPSVREVVSQITINPTTVHRAYRDLEHDGLVEARAGLGTFVATSASASVGAEDRVSLLRDLAAWVSRARAGGLDDDTITGMLAGVLSSREVAPR